MTPKDPPKPGSPKSELLDDLTSLKSTLDEDDDNVPLLLDNDDDVPLLGDDEDIPVLDTLDTRAQQAADKASLEAALKQLESMELAPRSRKLEPPAEPKNIEDKIRANAAEPLIKQEELTRVRENPFLNQTQKAQLELNRKLREEAKKMAEIAALSKPRSAAPPAPKPPAPVEESVIEFTDNPFLKASAAPAASAPAQSAASASLAAPAEEEDGSAEILKELEEDLPLSTRKVEATPQDGLGDIILGEDDLAAEPAASGDHKAEVDALVDEVISEYLVVLETALRKKLKEKLPHLLKK